MAKATTQERTREMRLRRMADRQGLKLVKSGRRDTRAIDFGKWSLVDQLTGSVVAGVGPLGRPEFTANDVEAYLTGDHEATEGSVAKRLSKAVKVEAKEVQPGDWLHLPDGRRYVVAVHHEPPADVPPGCMTRPGGIVIQRRMARGHDYVGIDREEVVEVDREERAR